MIRQKILITGASSGLGEGMARAFAAKGRDLALCARRTERLDALKAELTQRHPGITVAVAELDVNDHDQVPKVFGELSDALGGIDRVIVNAGIGKGAPLGSGKLWANKATLETNLVAALVQIEAALEMFKASGRGHLVLVSSVLANKGVPGVKASYAASKAGVNGFIRSAALELAGRRVTVNGVEPGYIAKQGGSLLSNPERAARIARHIPAGELGRPEDIAYAMCFLASDAARYITGQTIVVDGGSTLPESPFFRQ